MCFQSCLYDSVVPEFVVVYFIWYWLVDPYHNSWLTYNVSVYSTVNNVLARVTTFTMDIYFGNPHSSIDWLHGVKSFLRS